MLVILDKNITFANEKSVLLISAEHCRIWKPAGFQIEHQKSKIATNNVTH